MVRPTAGAHEDRATAEDALDDLEPEDPAVELRGAGRVADVEDGVVEARDGDAHASSLRLDHRRVTGHGQAATAAVEGAPTSFQPDCQLPPWVALIAMLRKARPSS